MPAFSRLRALFSTFRSSKLLKPTREESLELYRPGGYHPVSIGDTFCNSRYIVLRKLGWGQYSTVWLAKDASSNMHVALKILKDDAGKGDKKLHEVPILQRIDASDHNHPGKAHVAQMLHHFEHTGPNGNHICMTFDVLGDTVDAIQKRFSRGIVPLPLVKQIGRETLLALDFLHRSCGIIHTDVKPDNVLATLFDGERVIQQVLAGSPVRATPTHTSSPHVPRFIVESQPIVLDHDYNKSDQQISFKLTDFGVCNWVDNHLVDVIQDPALRAPEVVLGAPWDTSVDIWSVGCILYYLFCGRRLFNPAPSEDPKLTAEEDHIVQIITLLGQFPLHLIQTGKNSSKFFDPETGSLIRLSIPPNLMVNLNFVLQSWAPSNIPPRELHGFADLLSRMLLIEPTERQVASDLVQHPWLTGQDFGPEIEAAVNAYGDSESSLVQRGVDGAVISSYIWHSQHPGEREWVTVDFHNAKGDFISTHRVLRP